MSEQAGDGSQQLSSIKNLNNFFMTAFIVVALGLVFWGVIQANEILARNDNPRLVEAELRIRRGTIFDNNGRILADTRGSLERPERYYPIPDQTPGIGYYSFLHGTGGIEEGFDTHLRGDPDDFWNGVKNQILHLNQEGREIKLALNADIQQSAVSNLRGYNGALFLVELPHDRDGQALVRAMASLPSYDPNNLDDQFDELGSHEFAPLLNRVTQGQYQPGLLVQPLILAKSLDSDLIKLDEVVAEADSLVTINETPMQCSSRPPESATWADVLKNNCPAPMEELANDLGIDGLYEIFTSFALVEDPQFEIDTATSPDDPLEDPFRAAIGHDNLSITPFKIGLAYASMFNDGIIPQAQIVTEIESKSGTWQPWTINQASGNSLSSSPGDEFLDLFKQPGGFYEFNPLVLSGPGGTTNAWYIGFSEGKTSNYLVVVVLEDVDQEHLARDAGRNLLDSIN